jgi:Trypsin
MHKVSDVVSIANIIPFEEFDPETLQNDIAIVQLNRPARLSGMFREVSVD